MKISHFNRLSSLLQSIEDRTSLSVGYHDYTRHETGRNGFSHDIRFDKGHTHKGVISYDEVVFSRNQLALTQWRDYKEALVPKSLVNSFFKRTPSLPEFWGELIWVYLPHHLQNGLGGRRKVSYFSTSEFSFCASRFWWKLDGNFDETIIKVSEMPTFTSEEEVRNWLFEHFSNKYEECSIEMVYTKEGGDMFVELYNIVADSDLGTIRFNFFVVTILPKETVEPTDSVATE